MNIAKIKRCTLLQAKHARSPSMHKITQAKLFGQKEKAKINPESPTKYEKSDGPTAVELVHAAFYATAAQPHFW